MVKKNELEGLINLDGGVCSGINQVDRIGWNYEGLNKLDLDSFLEENGYSYDSKFLLGSYAGTSCLRINSYLRSQKGKGDPILDEYERLLVKALDELPTYDGQLCYRWVSLPNEAIDFLSNLSGVVVQIPQFWSTSKFRNDAGYETTFVIGTLEETNSRYIADVVGKTEGEVLFKPNTNFRIIGINEGELYFKETKSDSELVLSEKFWI